MYVRSGSLVLTLMLLLPSVSDAQRVPDLGERVQVRTESGRRQTGTLAFLSSDAVEILDGRDQTHFFPTDQIQGFRVASPVEEGEGAGGARAVKTFLILPTVAAGLGALTWSPCRATGFMACFLHPESRGDAALFGAAIGAVVAIPVALIVAVTGGPDDSWEDAVVPGGTHAGERLLPKTFPGALPGSVGVGLSVPLGR